MAASNTDFVQNIRKWVHYDSQIKLLNEKLKEARENKQKVLEGIETHVKQNDLEAKHIEISDGELRFYEKRDYSPLTFRYIEECLGKIISDVKQVDLIIDYLKTHRHIETSFDIRRNYKMRAQSFS